MTSPSSEAARIRACSSAKGGPSRVLRAMGLPERVLNGVVRISAGWETTPEDWATLLAAWIQVWEHSEHQDDVDVISLDEI